jgi:hypothetical protein
MTTFPTKVYNSSSAAYRAIRQFEQKHGKTDLIMNKISNGLFEVGNNGNSDFREFMEEKPDVQYENGTFRFFDEGSHGQGYYEIKTNGKIKPNSLFLTIKEVFKDVSRS